MISYISYMAFIMAAVVGIISGRDVSIYTHCRN